MTNVFLNQTEKLNDLFIQAKEKEIKGCLNDAASLYSEILQQNKDNEQALLAFAQLRKDMGMLEEATRLAKALCKINKKMGAPLVIEILIDNNNKNEAKEFIDSLLIAKDEKEKLEDLISYSSPDESSIKPEEDIAFCDADLVLMADLFAGRQGVHARQWRAPDGKCGYTPVYQPLLGNVIRQHLTAAATVGVYVIRLDNQVLFMALDVDAAMSEELDQHEINSRLNSVFKYTCTLLDRSKKMGLSALLEMSGNKGYHLWYFFDEPWPAHKARTLAQSIIKADKEPPCFVHTDIFPAQSYVKKGGLGNLIKMPLGIHLKSGRASYLLDENGQKEKNPLRMLRNVEKISVELLDDLYASIKIDNTPASNHGQINDTNESVCNETIDEAVHSRSQIVTYDDYCLNNDEELAWLKSKCPILGLLVKKCLKGTFLTHEEQNVLTYSIGHLTNGAKAINLLFETTPGFVPLKNRLRGHPTSCKKIRKNLGLLTGELKCNCSFDSTLGPYAHPLLHLASLQTGQKNFETNIPGQLAELDRLNAEILRLSDLASKLKNQLNQTGANPGSRARLSETESVFSNHKEPIEA